LLSNGTKTGDLEIRILVYNVRKLRRPRMSDAFLAGSVGYNFSWSFVQQLRCSDNLHDQLASL